MDNSVFDTIDYYLKPKIRRLRAWNIFLIVVNAILTTALLCLFLV